MKWRWRRRVKVAPGVTVNLSPTSVGASVGGPAGRVSANTKGRVTAGQSLPGTGLYSQTTLASGAQPAKKQQQGGGCAVLAAALMLLVGCGVIGLGATSMVRRPDLAPTPTAPARAVEPIPLDTPALSTATPVVVETTGPLVERRSVLLPLVVGAVAVETPTDAVVATFTPWPTLTAMACDCSQDAYNCGDDAALFCFDVCWSQKSEDVHGLDQNDNGVACEDY